MIYEQVFKVDGKINPSKRLPTTYHRAVGKRAINKHHLGPPPSSALALLQTCKDVFKEAVGIYYKLKEFVFYHPNQMMKFFHAISESGRRRNYIRSITLWYDNNRIMGEDSIELPLMLLDSQVPNLTSLEVVFGFVFSSISYRQGRAIQIGSSGLPGFAHFKHLVAKGVDLRLRCMPAERLIFEDRGQERSEKADKVRFMMGLVQSWESQLRG